jgi:hypothetical protein
MTDFEIKSGGTAPPLRVSLLDGTGPLNLSGATVTMSMRRADGGPLVLTDAAVQIVGDPTLGVVEYQWQPGDTATDGKYIVQWDVTFSNGAVQPFPTEGFTEVTIYPDLEADATVMPPMPDNCWPVDDSVCSALDSYPGNIAERAKALATQTLRILTARTVGGCPITVLPHIECRSGHEGFTPVNMGGQWYNTCPCWSLIANRIRLAAPIGRVDEVTVGGVALPVGSYRVESGQWLVRTDGENWPQTQDEGFTVTYLRAWPVDGLGSVAAGILACEYAKALTGDAKCSLPRTVREINRQGISMTLTTDLFPNGLTGIREVDAYIQFYNPHGLRSQPAIYVPGRSPRVLS